MRTSRYKKRNEVRDYLTRCLDGLETGEPLPPMRTLAKESGASLARLNGLLQELDSWGLIDRRPRQGIFKKCDRKSLGKEKDLITAKQSGNSAGLSTNRESNDQDMITVGIVLDNWPERQQNSYLDRLFRYLRDRIAMQSRSLRVLFEFADMDGGAEAELPRLLSMPEIDAAVFLPFSPEGVDFISNFKPNGKPVFSFTGRVFNPALTSIYIDDCNGAERVTRHFAYLGHRRIACLLLPAVPCPAEDRLTGYKNVLREQNIPFDPSLVLEVGHNYYDINQSLKRLFAIDDPATAIFVTDGTLLPFTMQSLMSMNKRVPQDVSLIAYDDKVEYASYASPLSAVRQPLEQACEVLLDELVSIVRNVKAPAKHIAILPELIMRDSCIPLRG